MCSLKAVGINASVQISHFDYKSESLKPYIEDVVKIITDTQK